MGVFDDFVDSVSDTFSPVVSTISSFAGGIGDAFTSAFQPLSDTVRGLAPDMGWYNDLTGGLYYQALQRMRETASDAGEAITSVATSTAKAVDNINQTIAEVAQPVGDFLKQEATAIGEYAVDQAIDFGKEVEWTAKDFAAGVEDYAKWVGRNPWAAPILPFYVVSNLGGAGLHTVSYGLQKAANVTHRATAAPMSILNAPAKVPWLGEYYKTAFKGPLKYVNFTQLAPMALGVASHAAERGSQLLQNKIDKDYWINTGISDLGNILRYGPTRGGVSQFEIWSGMRTDDLMRYGLHAGERLFNGEAPDLPTGNDIEEYLRDRLENNPISYYGTRGFQMLEKFGPMLDDVLEPEEQGELNPSAALAQVRDSVRHLWLKYVGNFIRKDKMDTSENPWEHDEWYTYNPETDGEYFPSYDDEDYYGDEEDGEEEGELGEDDEEEDGDQQQIHPHDLFQDFGTNDEQARRQMANSVLAATTRGALGHKFHALSQLTKQDIPGMLSSITYALDMKRAPGRLTDEVAAFVADALAHPGVNVKHDKRQSAVVRMLHKTKHAKIVDGDTLLIPKYTPLERVEKLVPRIPEGGNVIAEGQTAPAVAKIAEERPDVRIVIVNGHQKPHKKGSARVFYVNDGSDLKAHASAVPGHLTGFM